jgi:N-acetylglucosamine-6-sulfatase
VKRSWFAAAAVCAAVVLFGAACTETTLPPPKTHKPKPTGSPLPPPTFPSPSPSLEKKPNIVLILTDDQTLAEMGHMPTVASELAGKGMTFQNGFVVNPLCCPSRTTILTGKYSHSTHVYTNLPPYGGFKGFGHEDKSTIATWLQAAGYDTGLIGKYLNGYNNAGYVPPGWDTWEAFTKNDYFHYALSDRGRRVPFGGKPTDYSTTVLGNDAVQFIEEAPSNRPLFLYFATKAPHVPATPEPKYANALSDLPPYRPPNFNEADVADKPAWLRATPPLTARQIADVDAFYRNQTRTLLSVDDQVRNILDALQETGRLSNTLIVYFSDNGLENGAHRLLNKQVPYEESIHVPLIVRYDPVTKLHASTNTALALNVDFAPTFADAADVLAPGVEGHSLLPLLAGDQVKWRTEFVVEHVVEPHRPGAPTFCAVRTTRYAYVLYSGVSGEELYDLRTDPYELQNLAAEPQFASLKAQLRADDLRLCSPRPPGWLNPPGTGTPTPSTSPTS